jgi:hypothetical protein
MRCNKVECQQVVATTRSMLQESKHKQLRTPTSGYLTGNISSSNREQTRTILGHHGVLAPCSCLAGGKSPKILKPQIFNIFKN